MKKLFNCFLVSLILLSLWGCTSKKEESSETEKKNTNTFTVIFDSQGGSDVDSIEIEKGKELKLPAEPVREGYSFIMWVDEEEVPYFDGDILDIESELTLKAVWVKALTINFDSQGGSEMDPIILTEGELLYLPEEPVKEGYSFEGWQNDQGEFVNDESEIDVWSNDAITLTAVWK